MKKLTSLILVLTILVSAFSFSGISVYAEGEGYADLPKNQQTIQLLNTLGVAQNLLKGYNETATMTRRQFCIMMKDFLGISFGSTSNLIPFDDVMDYDPDIAVLRTMSELGFMYGFDDNTFRPDENVTYEDAITVMVNMLGYKLPAESKGGYPMGYLAVAASEGLIEGVTPVSGKAITQGEILTLLSNFIEIPVLEQVSFGNDNKFQAIEDETILAKHFNVYKGNGIVNGTYESMLDMSSALTEEKVQIGDSILYINGTNAVSYFGYDVEYYYELNKSGISKLIGVFPTESNEELVIDVADKGEFDGDQLIYFVDGSNREYKARIQIGTVTVYNGAASSFDKDIINNMQEGYLKFLDNNGDGRYDVLFVEEVQYFVVKSVDKVNEVLYGKYSLTSGDNIIKLDDDTYDVKYTITDANGNPSDISKIKEWDVLSITKATIGNDKIVKIKTCSNMVSGIVNGISGVFGDYDYVVLNDTQYKISNTMNALIEDGQIADFELGDEISLALSVNGTVVTTKSDTKFTGKLGLIVEYGYLDISGKNYYIEFVDDSGSKVEALLAPEFKFMYADSSNVFDDKIEVKSSEFANFEQAITACMTASVPRCIFRYDLDADGNICEIELATDATSNTSLLEKNRLSLVMNTGSTSYRIYPNVLMDNTTRTTTAKYYRLSSGAKVFTAPRSLYDDDGLYTVSSDMKDFVDRFADDDAYMAYKLLDGQFYVYGDMPLDLVAVKYSKTGTQLVSTTVADRVFVVSKVSKVKKVIDDNEETLIKLTGITGKGAEDTAYVRDLRTASQSSANLTFNFGDILLLNTDENGYCTFHSNAAVTAMDTAYNSTNFRDYGVPILRLVKTTAQGTSTSRQTFTMLSNADMIASSGKSGSITFPIEISDGRLYLGHYTDESINGSSTKYTATRSYGIGSEKVFILDSKNKEIRKGTIDEAITVDKKFPADRYRALAHDDATVMYTIASLASLQTVFIFK